MSTKSLILISLALSLNHSCLAQDKGKCVSGNCVNGTGVFEIDMPEGHTNYKGSFKNGSYNGQGTLTIKDKFQYTGTFKDGKEDGKGVASFIDEGWVYTGELKDGHLEGNGTAVFKNGKKSIGLWKDGRFWSGTGQFLYDKNGTYYGGVIENKPDGKGVRSYPNGKNFTGLYSKGQPVSGKGYIYYPSDSSSYEGEMSDTAFNGKGVLTYANGEKYEGNFKDSYFDGYGVYHYSDGAVYKGNWKEDKRNGSGEYYDANGKLDYSGSWADDERTNSENSTDSKKEQWEYAQNVFSRVTFKGFEWVTINGHRGQVITTDEYHLNPDYTLSGSKEIIIPSDEQGGPNHRFKEAISGSFDPVTKMIYIITGKMLYAEPIKGLTIHPGIHYAGKVYGNNSHAGYYIIKGKNGNDEEFEETDYQ